MSALEHASFYGEYGCGLSTKYVAQNTNIPIVSVDTSRDWVVRLQSQVRRDNVNLGWVDLGEVGEWGRPLSYVHDNRIPDYLTYPWRSKFSPDLVLIDGRFRVACFATCLLNAIPGTIIIFDDYPGRQHYMIVERLLKPKAINARQAMFEVPKQIDERSASKMISDFLYVMD